MVFKCKSLCYTGVALVLFIIEGCSNTGCPSHGVFPLIGQSRIISIDFLPLNSLPFFCFDALSYLALLLNDSSHSRHYWLSADVQGWSSLILESANVRIVALWNRLSHRVRWGTIKILRAAASQEHRLRYHLPIKLPLVMRKINLRNCHVDMIPLRQFLQRSI